MGMVWLRSIFLHALRRGMSFVCALWCIRGGVRGLRRGSQSERMLEEELLPISE